MLRKGFILLSGGRARHVLTLTPPLTMTEAEADHATRALKEVLNGTD
jgi:4-aminobutyrate aminotransferase-like enzyme